MRFYEEKPPLDPRLTKADCLISILESNKHPPENLRCFIDKPEYFPLEILEMLTTVAQSITSELISSWQAMIDEAIEPSVFKRIIEKTFKAPLEVRKMMALMESEPELGGLLQLSMNDLENVRRIAEISDRMIAKVAL